MSGLARVRRRQSWGVLLVVATLLSAGLALAGCTQDEAAADERASRGLTVFAAASLADALDGLEERWLASHPDVPLTTALDGSSVLAAQIAEGAPADVFMSADTRRPAELARAGHAAVEPVPFARNRVTIAVPLDGSVVKTARDLAAAGVRLVAAGPGVPITSYADEVARQLAATTADPAAFLARLGDNIVSREDNVRAALAKVELGEGDAVMVYATDARSSELVREIPLPASVDVSAEYAALQVSDRPAAAAFVDWLTGPEAGEVLRAYGFEAGTG